jgi:hypothetical protein
MRPKICILRNLLASGMLAAASPLDVATPKYSFYPESGGLQIDSLVRET